MSLDAPNSGETELGPVNETRKRGNESFHRSGRPLGFDIVDFWQWSASGFLGNAQRGVLAEYLVAKALGAANGLRTGWDPFDLTTSDGVKVEVKSAAYIQNWHQERHSRISFGIGGARAWDSRTNVMAPDTRRHADVYVFCLLHHLDQTTAEPMDLDHWTFYVLPASVLNEKCPNQKTTGLPGLLYLGAVETPYEQLAEAVRRAVTDG